MTQKKSSTFQLWVLTLCFSTCACNKKKSPFLMSSHKKKKKLIKSATVEPWRSVDTFLLSHRMDHFDGLIPFDFKTEPADSNSKYLGEYSQRYQQQHMWTLFRVIHGSALLLWLSEPPLLGAHLLLQWPFVRCRGEEACVGLRPHRHTAACGDHQPRWVDLWWPTSITEAYVEPWVSSVSLLQ